MWLRGQDGIIRWYDPVTGRWLSKDPVGISGGVNQYVFCGNDPVNRRDPFGLCEKSEEDIDREFRQLLEQDPLLPWIAPFSLTGLLNLKSPGTLKLPGASPWTSIDKKWPWLPGANPNGGFPARQTGRGPKPSGTLGAAATAISVFSTIYSVTAPAVYYGIAAEIDQYWMDDVPGGGFVL